MAEQHELMREALLPLRHSPIRNYVIPGLTSWLIGQPTASGTVRLFENSRNHQENITPHSHRFDFRCWVLRGRVRNKVWSWASYQGDWFMRTALHYKGQTGAYERGASEQGRYTCRTTEYGPGEWYGMKAHEIHSIEFDAGTEVLFIEGPSTKDSSVILEPQVDGEVIPTFEVKPWMFKRTDGVASPQAPSYELHGYLVYETKFGGHWDFHPKDELPAGEFLKHREHTPVYVRNAGVGGPDA